MTDDTDQILESIGVNQRPLAEAAASFYREHGRGALRVDFPRTRTRALVVVEYDTLAHLREGDPRGSEDDMATLIRMVEEYDPAHQAVVLACLSGGLPVTVKMKLPPPTGRDEPTSVH